jgi:guanylate kinase
MAKGGKLIVISGPSGSGKTTVVSRLLQLEADRLVLSVSATTRPPRDGERDGVNYHFLSAEEFERRRAQGDFLECAEVYPGLWYGTLRQAVAPSLAGGKSVVLEIDVQGRASVAEQYPDAITIFIHPPSLETLEHRLRGRRSETEASLQRRLAVARREIAAAGQYQYQITNDDVDETVETIRDILLRTEAI